MDATTIRIAIRDLPDQFDANRIPVVLEVLARVLSEQTGAEVPAFADSMIITLHVPTARLLAAATALRDMRII